MNAFTVPSQDLAMTNYCVVLLLAGCTGSAGPRSEPVPTKAKASADQFVVDAFMERQRSSDSARFLLTFHSTESPPGTLHRRLHSDGQAVLDTVSWPMRGWVHVDGTLRYAADGRWQHVAAAIASPVPPLHWPPTLDGP